MVPQIPLWKHRFGTVAPGVIGAPKHSPGTFERVKDGNSDGW